MTCIKSKDRSEIAKRNAHFSVLSHTTKKNRKSSTIVQFSKYYLLCGCVKNPPAIILWHHHNPVTPKAGLFKDGYFEA